MYYTDMIRDYIHDAPFNLLHLCHIRLHLETPVHGLKLLYHERLQGVHVLDKGLCLLHEFRGLGGFS